MNRKFRGRDWRHESRLLSLQQFKRRDWPPRPGSDRPADRVRRNPAVCASLSLEIPSFFGGWICHRWNLCLIKAACCQLITRKRSSHHIGLSGGGGWGGIFLLPCICLRFPPRWDSFFFTSLFASQELQRWSEQQEPCSVWEYMLASKRLWHVGYFTNYVFVMETNEYKSDTICCPVVSGEGQKRLF